MFLQFSVCHKYYDVLSDFAYILGFYLLRFFICLCVILFSDLREEASKKKERRKNTALKYKPFGIAMPCGLISVIKRCHWQPGQTQPRQGYCRAYRMLRSIHQLLSVTATAATERALTGRPPTTTPHCQTGYPVIRSHTGHVRIRMYLVTSQWLHQLTANQ